MRTATRARGVGIILSALCCAVYSVGLSAQTAPAATVHDGGSPWVELLTADLTTCAERQCASVDDRACASNCDSSRASPPECREVDCSACLDANVGCEGGSCADRVCVLCAWPGAGDDLNAVCHASSTAQAGARPQGDDVDGLHPRALVEQAALSLPRTQHPAWALYEVKDHRYRLLTSGVLGGPRLVPRGDDARSDPSSGLRERIRGMGMLALIRSSRERGDDPVAHVFSAGASFEESVRSSLEDASAPREALPSLHTSPEGRPAVHDVRAILFERALPPVAKGKRASTINPRLGGERMIDIDGELDDERVGRALHRSRDAFRLCYENAFKAHSPPSGRLTLEFEVDRTGRVVEAVLTDDELHSGSLSHCALSTLGRLRFPTHESDSSSFRAVLSFRQRSSDG